MKIITQQQLNFIHDVLLGMPSFNETGENLYREDAIGALSSLEDLSEAQLKEELRMKGYYTDGLWHIDDVQNALDSYNLEYSTSLTLTDEEKQGVLSEALGDCTQGNEDITTIINSLINPAK